MKKNLILMLVLILATSASRLVIAQTADDNYVVSYKAITPLSGDLANVNDKTKVSVSIEYFDGLGRPLQSIAKQGSPKGFDVVSFSVYDQYGRKSQNYLPYVASASTGNVRTSPTPEQLAFYQAQVGAVDGANAFSVQLFENADLNRVIKTGAPGADWQPNSSDAYSLNDRTVKKRYEVNSANDVLKFSYNRNTGQLILATDANRYYDQSKLTASKTIDEHGNDVVEYVDKEGRTICKKVKASPTEYAVTYYVYDDLGNLLVVLPPEALKAITSP